MAATSLVGSFTGLFITRLIMGAGEATSIRSCGQWMPAQERGVANMFWSAGSFVGPAIGAVINASIASTFGWRAAFVFPGALGFVWLACKLIWFDRPERVKWLTDDERDPILSERSAGSPDEIGIHGSPAVVLELPRSPSMWGTMIGQAAGVYTLYLLLFWLPSYLQDTKHLSIMKTGPYTAVPWAIAVPVSLAIGALSDRLLQSQTLLTAGRRAMVIACVRLAAVVVFVPFTTRTALILMLFRVVPFRNQCRHLAQSDACNRSRSSRARDVGKAIGLTILSGNICGLLAPVITGYVVDGLYSYDWALWIAGMLLAIGAVALGTMTRAIILPGAEAAPGAFRGHSAGVG